eukprot:1160648-Pelagomonas_calceolata.AAC.11
MLKRSNWHPGAGFQTDASVHGPCLLEGAPVASSRYVHGFKQRKNAQDVESGLDAEKRYGRMYDEGINPFAEFQVGADIVDWKEECSVFTLDCVPSLEKIKVCMPERVVHTFTFEPRFNRDLSENSVRLMLRPHASSTHMQAACMKHNCKSVGYAVKKKEQFLLCREQMLWCSKKGTVRGQVQGLEMEARGCALSFE